MNANAKRKKVYENKDLASNKEKIYIQKRYGWTELCYSIKRRQMNESSTNPDRTNASEADWVKIIER
jgi:hypothetical protein